MKVRPQAATGVADPADDGSGSDDLPGFYIDA
jgi:hypothetical protein